MPDFEVFSASNDHPCSRSGVVVAGKSKAILGICWMLCHPSGVIREAIVQFRDGDFDLILLGYSIPIESQERLTFLIRASGSRIPVVCISDSLGHHDGFADATIRNEGDDLLQVIEELSATRNGLGGASCEADERAQPHLMGGMRTLQMLWPRRTSKPGGGIR